MSDENKTVYILGAGCSAGEPPTGPGFPLASGFSTALEKFGQGLGENSERLKKCVLNTISASQKWTVTMFSICFDQQRIARVYLSKIYLEQPRRYARD
jgi:hypothetical protein